MIKTHILVIDDEEIIRDSCVQVLSSDECDVQTAEDGQKGLELIRERLYDIVVLDLKMPGVSGMEVLKEIRTHFPETLVVVITGYASVESAVEAMREGAYDFIPKPFTPDEIRFIVKRAVEKRRLRLENLYLQEMASSMESFALVGQSGVMQEIAQLIHKVGPSESTVLITGESGTGKELVARAIHQASPRKNMPFVTVDCSTLVENLFESELFGHVKGSFTGATATKHGRLELANGGTVFFDEIGNIGTTVQAKLLRAIQEREITKVGSNQAIRIDIRIIAATNKDLMHAVKSGQFREDLFYRLSVVPVHLPPLRQRRDDIRLLAEYFLKKYNARKRKSVRGMVTEAMDALMCYDWPGNVRELENAIERAVVLTDHEWIQPSDLLYLGKALEPSPSEHKTLQEMEKEYIEKMLVLYQNHKVHTAKALGIDRKTLRRKMREYGIGFSSD